MTYCLAMCLPAGLVFGADTRTNAGIDYVTTYSKMHCVQPAADRVFVILSAGNLATTQEIVSRLQRDLDTPESLDEGAKLALISLDATIRSNVTVGPPFELAIYPTNSLRLPQRTEITVDSPCYIAARTIWQNGLRETFQRLPNVEWTDEPAL